MEEREQLIQFASAIRSRLSHFEELEKIATQFHTLASSQSSIVPVESGEVDPYLLLLKKLDESISYVSAHPQYAEASLYMTQFRRLQAQALGGIRHRVTSVLKTCTQKFMEGLATMEDSDLQVKEYNKQNMQITDYLMYLLPCLLQLQTFLPVRRRCN